MAAWVLTDLAVDDQDIVTARFARGADVVEILAVVVLEGGVGTLHGLHVQGNGANSLGVRGLLELIGWAKGYFDVGKVRIAGAARTSGAGPGRTPRPFDV
jgi:hypothetical protein